MESENLLEIAFAVVLMVAIGSIAACSISEDRIALKALERGCSIRRLGSYTQYLCGEVRSADVLAE